MTTDAPTVTVGTGTDEIAWAEGPDGVLSAPISKVLWDSLMARLDTPPSWLDRDPANIHEAIARAMVELPGIGKGGTAAPEQGSYRYRGIEQITAEAQGVLGRLGVMVYPIIVGDPVVTTFQVNSRPWTETTMRIRYRFVHGPSGTKLTVGGKRGLVAIARDNSDKGANKCMTQAYKYALIQTLMIGDKADDVDAGSPEGDAPAPLAWEHFGYETPEAYEEVHQQVVNAWAMLSPEQVESAREWLRGKEITRKWPLPADVADELFDRLRAIAAQEAQADAEGTGEPPTPAPIGTATPVSLLERPVAALALDEAKVRADLAGTERPCTICGVTEQDDAHKMADHLRDVRDGPRRDGAKAPEHDWTEAQIEWAAQVLSMPPASADAETPAESDTGAQAEPETATEEKRRRAPSAAELIRRGVTEEQIAEVAEEVATMNNAEVGAALKMLGYTLGGSESERATRLTCVMAEEKFTSDATVMPIGGETD